ncbi:MAG: ATP-dependent helicase RecG, partial [Mycobacterium sp.]|nr:ATP-dependent helicase RecG [Mycobacterium sp.]
MAVLTDRLDYVLGKKAAGPLEEHFGIRTVNDLLRHYPRKYSDGMTVLGEGEELEEGEHVTFVDVITATKVGDMKPRFDPKTKKMKKPKWLRVTLGHRRPEVTATFFNAGYMIENLPKDTRLMLSGEVKYFRGTMQLSHPAFLVLESPTGRQIGTKSLKTIASMSGATDDELLSVFEREFFPIYPANAKVQSWDIYACVRQVLAVLDPIDEPLPEP